MFRKLIITAAALTLAVSAQAGVPKPVQLVDTAWTITRIDGKKPASLRAEIRFLSSRISATAGCNGLGGDWKIRKGRLEGGPFMATMMYCEGLMEQERVLADVLGGKARIDVTGRTLTLKSGKHVIVATRRR